METPYDKTVWYNDNPPYRSAENLNKQEEGIYQNSLAIIEIGETFVSSEGDVALSGALTVADDFTFGGNLFFGATEDWWIPDGGATSDLEIQYNADKKLTLGLNGLELKTESDGVYYDNNRIFIADVNGNFDITNEQILLGDTIASWRIYENGSTNKLSITSGDGGEISADSDSKELNLTSSEITYGSTNRLVGSDTSVDTGSDQIYNIVSLTQAEYDALTPVSTTLYVIV